MDQNTLRRRRRAHMPVVNDGSWSLRREVADVAGPLADRVAARPNPLQFRRQVLAYADAAHEAVGTVTGWVAERDARRRTEHLAGDEGKRKYAITTLVDLAPRPALPDITDEMLADGSWVAALTEMAEPVDGALSDLLAHAFPPGAPALRGQLSRSDRLESLLRETVDRAALTLERALNAEVPSITPTAPEGDPRAALAALGIDV
ncbi:hypothetical protein H7J51_24900 [Mycobacterium crocinum]|uniref:Uncharacterized protein n=1 Tax=Mycolicibacterium crocinum TaxID=388459 RepID=A0ABY3TG13_9MYCO|nr:hypothetical protein [Mycolicibacterium crocinum]MCV7218503.1 hypothetical protein [Mycolicibacterium crocinum]ULN40402.1 hypothetical protein MI149_22460 [Mycolicibacterium crocinum]